MADANPGWSGRRMLPRFEWDAGGDGGFLIGRQGVVELAETIQQPPLCHCHRYNDSGCASRLRGEDRLSSQLKGFIKPDVPVHEVPEMAVNV